RDFSHTGRGDRWHHGGEADGIVVRRDAEVAGSAAEGGPAEGDGVDEGLGGDGGAAVKRLVHGRLDLQEQILAGGATGEEDRQRHDTGASGGVVMLDRGDTGAEDRVGDIRDVNQFAG